MQSLDPRANVTPAPPNFAFPLDELRIVPNDARLRELDMTRSDLGLAVQAVMKHRGGREILGIVTLVVIVTVVYLPQIVESTADRDERVKDAELDDMVQKMETSGRYLVPVIAGRGLAALEESMDDDESDHDRRDRPDRG